MERARDLGLDDSHCQFHLAEVRRAAGQLEVAVTDYRAALSAGLHTVNLFFGLGTALLDLQNAEGWRQLARALRRRAQYQEPLEAAMRANTLALDQHGPAFELGNVLRELERFAEAADWYRKAIELCPRHAPSLTNLGLCLEHLGDSAKARSCFRQAIVAKPDFAEAHFNLGVNLQSEGRFDEAMAAHERALALAPTLAEARYSLALIGDRPTTPHDLAALEALAKNSEANEEQRAHACFALARHLEDEGDTGRAFAYYRRANELKKRRLAFEPAWHVLEVDRLIETFSASFFAGWPSSGSATVRPIFIV